MSERDEFVSDLQAWLVHWRDRVMGGASAVDLDELQVLILKTTAFLRDEFGVDM